MTTPLPLSRRLNTTSGFGASSSTGGGDGLGGGTKRKGLSERRQPPQQLVSSSPSSSPNNNKRQNRGSSITTSVDNTTTTTTTKKSSMLFSQSLLVESLQASLEHERSMREIDQQRYEQKMSALEKQIEYVSQQASQEVANANKIQSRSDALIHQMEQSRNTALEKLRESQMEVLELQSSVDTDSNQQFHFQRIQNELSMLREKEIDYKQTIEQLQNEIEDMASKSVEQSSKRQREAQQAAIMSPTSPQQPTTSATTRTTSSEQQQRQELTKTRIKLADAERQVRQYERKYNELLAEVEQPQLSKSRYEKLSDKYRTLQSNFETVNAINKAWKQFGQTLNNHKLFSSSISDSSKDNKDSNNNDEGPQQQQKFQLQGPPEVSTVLRHLQQINYETTQVHQRLQKQENECQRLRSGLSSTQDEIVELRNTANQLRIERDNIQQQYKTAQDKITTLQASESIANREKQSLRDLIQTFDFEQQQGIGGPTTTSSTTTSGDASIDTKTLQLNLGSTQEQLSLVKTDRDRISQQYDECQLTCNNLREEIGTIKSKFALLKHALEKERTNVQQANDRAHQAETLAGKGQYDPNHTQVVHLRETPLAQILKEEIKVLQRQLEVARSNASGASSSSVAAVAGSATKGGIATPGVAVAGPDPGKLNKRLKENFKEQIALFREGVYLMTGYKVDMLPAAVAGERPTFRVRSVFAENESDHFILKWPQTQTAVSSLDVLDTEFAKQLTQTTSYAYMSKFHSLPAFLASVQLSLFEKQTVMM